MDQGSLTKYREAILGAQAIPTSSSPVNVAPAVQPQIANIQNAYTGTFQAGAAKRAINAVGGAATAQANQEEAAAKLKLQEEEEAAAALEKKKKDLLDPSKYRQEIAEDGGYKFFDPEGNEIDIKQFSGATGKHMTEVLKKSQNPADQEFVRNYGNVEKLGEIFQSGSKDDLKKYLKDNPDVEADYKELKKSLKRDPTFGDIVNTFRAGYSKFFNTDQPTNPVSTQYSGKTFKDLGADTRSLGEKIKGLLGGS